VITIPVNIEIKGRQIVLDLAEAKRYLENAERIVIMDCTCRVQRGNCDAPIHTCLRLNERATQALEIEELEKLNPKTQAGRIGGSVGTKKRIEMEKKAEDLDLRLLNL